MKILQYTWDRL